MKDALLKHSASAEEPASQDADEEDEYEYFEELDEEERELMLEEEKERDKQFGKGLQQLQTNQEERKAAAKKVPEKPKEVVQERSK